MGEMGKGVGTVSPRGISTLGKRATRSGTGHGSAPRVPGRIQEQGLATGNFLGLLHILIGRKISLADGTVVSQRTNLA